MSFINDVGLPYVILLRKMSRLLDDINFLIQIFFTNIFGFSVKIALKWVQTSLVLVQLVLVLVQLFLG